MATDKVKGPAICITSLDTLLLSEQMILRLSEDELQALKVMAVERIGKKSSMVQALQSLVGKLQHVSEVVYNIREILIFELFIGCVKKWLFVRIILL